MHLEKLKGQIPDKIYDEFIAIHEKYGINTPLRVAHFIAQCSHESKNFTSFYENMNYSADRLLFVFGKYFTTRHDLLALQVDIANEHDSVKKADLEKKYARAKAKAFAEDYEHKPEMIANYVYANRFGNGGVDTGDGWKFRGRGAIQTTFRDNYKAFSDYINDPEIMDNTDLVATKYPLASAVFYFNKKGLWKLCDKGSDKSIVGQITTIIQGGLLNVDERLRLFNHFHKLIQTV